ncbi:hypothetical protein BHD05_11155 [Marisediminicola antarctica]|uniref:Uncharacterized protein n=1 Tax=Marisediminicola antarctica TaxID=674079 RepID=A0A7L5ALB1_9MICO|nr:hypothetical protein BHD05_11155 [Marisediminicola antarctica]
MLGAVLALMTVVVLTACGARIDTTMNVSENGSGSRVIVATISGEDLGIVSNGSPAIDASIQKNLPGELMYSGISSTADGGATVTLTLEFASSADYEKKARALLSRGGNDEADLDFAVTDSLLLNGIRIEESFTSYDLLKWLFDGLIADGVVAESDAGNMYEMGSSVLNYGGESISQSGSFDHTAVVDNGFAGISMATDLADPDRITRTITYSVTTTKYASNKALYDEFFAESTPPGADLSAVDNGVWKMTFSGDAQAVTKFTDTATRGTSSELSVKTALAPNDPATLITTVIDVASCESICASGTAIQDTLTGGAGYTPESIEVDTSAGDPVVFENAPAITSIDALFEFGMFGGVTSTVNFVVPNEAVALVGDGFTTLFEPANGVGTLTLDKGENDTVYTAVVKGDGAETFAAAYAQWAPESRVSAVEQDGTTLFGREMSYFIDTGLTSILHGHAVTDETITTVALPWGQSVSSSSGELTTKSGITGTSVIATGASAQTAFQAGGPTFAGLLTIGFLFVVLLGLAFLLARSRRNVFTTLKGAGVRFKATMDAPDLGSLPGSRVQSASSGNAAGSVLGLGVGAPYVGSQRSMVEWPQHPVSPKPSASLFVLVPADQHKTTHGTSLFTLPFDKVADQIRGNLFAHYDAVGDSRPRKRTN